MSYRDEPLFGGGQFPRECSLHTCTTAVAILATGLTGDADSMSTYREGFCAEHAPDHVRAMVREMLRGGPIQNITLVLP